MPEAPWKALEDVVMRRTSRPVRVGAELHFVAVCGQRWGKAHDAGVGEEDVECVEVGEEFLGGGFDGL